MCRSIFRSCGHNLHFFTLKVVDQRVVYHARIHFTIEFVLAEVNDFPEFRIYSKVITSNGRWTTPDARLKRALCKIPINNLLESNPVSVIDSVLGVDKDSIQVHEMQGLLGRT